jgi:hypothetical protein
MLSMSSLVQTPCRSGSPHGVLGAVHAFAAAAVEGFGDAGGFDCPDRIGMAKPITPSATVNRPARHLFNFSTFHLLIPLSTFHLSL